MSDGCSEPRGEIIAGVGFSVQSVPFLPQRPRRRASVAGADLVSVCMVAVPAETTR